MFAVFIFLPQLNQSCSVYCVIHYLYHSIQLLSSDQLPLCKHTVGKSLPQRALAIGVNEKTKVPAALPRFVLAHNNRQLVFHHVSGDDGILPPTGFCREPAPGRDGAGLGLLCPFWERMEVCVTLLSCEDIEVLARCCFL